MRTRKVANISRSEIVGSFLNVVAEKIRFVDEEYKRRRYARTDCSCDSTWNRGRRVCDRIQNVGETIGKECESTRGTKGRKRKRARQKTGIRVKSGSTTPL